MLEGTIIKNGRQKDEQAVPVGLKIGKIKAVTTGIRILKTNIAHHVPG